MSLIAELLALALALPGVRHDVHAQRRGALVASAIVREVRSVEEARLALVWAFAESSWRLDVTGDDGRSIGLCQNSLTEIATARSTVRMVRVSAIEAARVCLHTFRIAALRCGGSLLSGLGYVATGRCSVGLSLVRRRCAAAGVSCR